MMLPYQICLIITSYLSYSDLECLSKIHQFFNQNFNNKFKEYKTFYDSITWSRRDWNAKVNDYFDIVIKCLFLNLPYEKVYRIKLLRSHFIRSLTPQSILEHVCFCQKPNIPDWNPKCVLCSPVLFNAFDLTYYESFYTGLSEVEVRIAKNLYKKSTFGFFGSEPNNWFHRLNTNSFVFLKNTEDF